MGQPKTTIELNGKLYDASTGVILKDSAPKSGVTVDGFIRRSKATKATTKPTPQPRAARASSAASGHKPQRSHTLMRHVVSKPTVAAPTTSPAKSQPAASSKPISLLQARQQRASSTTKSNLVSRFGNHTGSLVNKKVAPLAVRPHPNSPQQATLQSIAPPISKSLASPTTNSFEKALESASSHRQSPLKRQKLRHRAAKKLGVSNRSLSIASVTLVIVLLAGFTAYQNAPNISMRLAATRAGFSATLPGYTPSGFGMAGPIQTNPGTITVSFRSHSDNRSYDITQKPSNWTSDSLRSNFFASTDSPTAYQDKGKTIYLYNNGSSATWVNGGILYQISGNANLSSDQLVNIADSL